MTICFNNPNSTGVFSKRNRNAKRGFTFAEILAAMVLTAILIPVALKGVAAANRVSVLAERKTIAARLAENVMNEIIMNENWQFGGNDGAFEEPYTLYRWKMQTQNWLSDSMLQIDVFVYFPVQGQEYVVSLSALVDDSEEETTDENNV